MTEQKTDVKSLTSMFTNHDFQWVKGENFMETEVFDKVVAGSDGNFFINFKSGRRINYNILEEYLTWYPSPQKPQALPTEHVQQKQTEITSVKFVDSKDNVIYASESPIYNLLARQKKKDVDIVINIRVPLPSKDLFNVLVNSFDDAENEIIQFIIDSIDLEDIRKTLSRSIRENYYGINETPKDTVKKEKAVKEKKENE